MLRDLRGGLACERKAEETFRRFTLDQALNTTGNQGPEYKIPQYTTVTRIGNVTTVV